MKRKCIFLLLPVLLAATLAAAPHGESGIAAAAEPSVARQPNSPPAGLMATAPPARRDFTQQVFWTGTVEPITAVELTALESGRIVALEVGDQAHVAAGQVVARLGGVRIENRRAGLAAQIEALQRRLDLARQTVADKQASLRAQLTTREELAAAEDARLGLETQLRQARLELAELEKATRVTAPLAGLFTGRRFSVGQQVRGGQVLGRVVDPGRLRIVAALFPPTGSELAGKEATVSLGGGRHATGTVTSVLPEADGAGAVQVWIEGPQLDTRLRPGQAVGGILALAVHAGVLAVPKTAIVYDQQERPLLFVRKGEEYLEQRVELGLSEGGWVEVRSGLDADRQVVTRGAYELFYRRFNRQFKVPD